MAQISVLPGILTANRASAKIRFNSAVSQGAGRNKDRPSLATMRAAAKKHNKAAVSPRLQHREVSNRQRKTSLHHVVRTDAADIATFCT